MLAVKLFLYFSKERKSSSQFLVNRDQVLFNLYFCLSLRLGWDLLFASTRARLGWFSWKLILINFQTCWTKFIIPKWEKIRPQITHGTIQILRHALREVGIFDVPNKIAYLYRVIQSSAPPPLPAPRLKVFMKIDQCIFKYNLFINYLEILR